MSREERLDKLEKAWDMRCRGRSMPYIARELGISLSTVHSLLTTQANEVARRLTKKIEVLKAEQSEQLDHVIEEALDAWERSKEDAEKSRTKSLGAKHVKIPAPGTQMVRGDDGKDHKEPEERPGQYLGDIDTDDWDEEEMPEERRAQLLAAAGMNPDGSAMTMVERVDEVKGQVGDARYLTTAMKAMEAKRAIWGLDAPKAEAGTTPVIVKVYQGTSVEDLVKGISDDTERT